MTKHVGYLAHRVGNTYTGARWHKVEVTSYQDRELRIGTKCSDVAILSLGFKSHMLRSQLCQRCFPSERI